LKFEFVDASRSAVRSVTWPNALALGKPIALLPAVMLNRFRHGSIFCKTDGPIASPKDLNGGKIGVRSYAQTTGVWARGILGAEYGVDLDGITHVTNEAGHLKDYVEPTNVVRSSGGKKMLDMLLDGEIAGLDRRARRTEDAGDPSGRGECHRSRPRVVYPGQSVSDQPYGGAQECDHRCAPVVAAGGLRTPQARQKGIPRGSRNATGTRSRRGLSQGHARGRWGSAPVRHRRAADVAARRDRLRVRAEGHSAQICRGRTVRVRRALRVANGDLSVFVHRPASAGLLVLACLVLAAFSLPGLRPRVAEPD
jgi:hypothetical protein